jgi:hypothetical protein
MGTKISYERFIRFDSEVSRKRYPNATCSTVRDFGKAGAARYRIHAGQSEQSLLYDPAPSACCGRRGGLFY